MIVLCARVSDAYYTAEAAYWFGSVMVRIYETLSELA